jgi:hypothetical protein
MWFPVKELSLQVHLTEVPKREMFHLLSVLLFSKSPVNELPSRFPNRDPTERDARFKSLPLHILQGPLQRSPSSWFPLQSSHTERCSISTALLCLSLKVPIKWAPLQVSLWDPYGERCLFPKPSLTYLLESAINKVSLWNKISPSSQRPL